MSDEIIRILAQMRYKHRSDSLKNWNTNNPVLLEGEVGVVTGREVVGDGLEDETEKIKIGDGVTHWNDLKWWKGPRGADGIQGDKGEKGEPGLKGDKGEKGDMPVVAFRYDEQTGDFYYSVEESEALEEVRLGNIGNRLEFNKIYSNTIKSVKKGQRQLEITDISPLPHVLSCKVESKNLWGNKIEDEILAFESSLEHIFNKPLPPGTYTFSGKFSSLDESTECQVSRMTDENTSIKIGSCPNGYSSITFTSDVPIVGISFVASNSGFVEHWWSNLQIEKGETATEFRETIYDLSKAYIVYYGENEEETRKVKYADENGIVDGIVSLYPNMTLIAKCPQSMHGAIITCEYNADINKVTNDLKAEQNYNPESENAQSGKAVAEALSTKMDKTGSTVTGEEKIQLSHTTEYEGTEYQACINVSDNGITLSAPSSFYDGVDIIGNRVKIYSSYFGVHIHGNETYDSSKVRIEDLVEPTKDGDAVNLGYLNTQIGAIETVLDNIIALQNSLIGGESV